MAHALVHPSDQDHQRRMGGQRQIAEGGKAEAECDGNAGENAEAGDPHKENDQVEIAERPQPWLRQPKYPDQQANRQHRAQYDPDIAGPRQPQQCKQRHQADAGRQRRGAPDVGNLQGRRRDETLFVGVFVGGPRDQQQKT